MSAAAWRRRGGPAEAFRRNRQGWKQSIASCVSVGGVQKSERFPHRRRSWPSRAFSVLSPPLHPPAPSALAGRCCNAVVGPASLPLRGRACARGPLAKSSRAVNEGEAAGLRYLAPVVYDGAFARTTGSARVQVAVSSHPDER